MVNFAGNRKRTDGITLTKGRNLATPMMDCEMQTMAGNFGANYTPASIADIAEALPSKG